MSEYARSYPEGSPSQEAAHTAPTLFLLMAQYNGKTVVPLDQVCRDFLAI